MHIPTHKAYLVHYPALLNNIPTFLPFYWRRSECVDSGLHPTLEGIATLSSLPLFVHHCLVSLQSSPYNTTILCLVNRSSTIGHILGLANCRRRKSGVKSST